MKAELTSEDIGKLLNNAADHAKLFNDINRIIYRDFNICMPSTNTLLMVWAMCGLKDEAEPEAEEKMEICNYFKRGNGYCMAQRFGPVVYCGGDSRLCSKED